MSLSIDQICDSLGRSKALPISDRILAVSLGCSSGNEALLGILNQVQRIYSTPNLPIAVSSSSFLIKEIPLLLKQWMACDLFDAGDAFRVFDVISRGGNVVFASIQHSVLSGLFARSLEPAPRVPPPGRFSYFKAAIFCLLSGGERNSSVEKYVSGVITRDPSSIGWLVEIFAEFAKDRQSLLERVSFVLCCVPKDADPIGYATSVVSHLSTNRETEPFASIRRSLVEKFVQRLLLIACSGSLSSEKRIRACHCIIFTLEHSDFDWTGEFCCCLCRFYFGSTDAIGDSFQMAKELVRVYASTVASPVVLSVVAQSLVSVATAASSETVGARVLELFPLRSSQIEIFCSLLRDRSTSPQLLIFLLSHLATESQELCGRRQILQLAEAILHSGAEGSEELVALATSLVAICCSTGDGFTAEEEGLLSSIGSLLPQDAVQQAQEMAPGSCSLPSQGECVGRLLNSVSLEECIPLKAGAVSEVKHFIQENGKSLEEASVVEIFRAIFPLSLDSDSYLQQHSIFCLSALLLETHSLTVPLLLENFLVDDERTRVIVCELLCRCVVALGTCAAIYCDAIFASMLKRFYLEAAESEVCCSILLVLSALYESCPYATGSFCAEVVACCFCVLEGVRYKKRCIISVLIILTYMLMGLDRQSLQKWLSGSERARVLWLLDRYSQSSVADQEDSLIVMHAKEAIGALA